MTLPRRRILRPEPIPAPTPQRQQRMHTLRTRLDAQRASLARWMGRLRRAFHTMEKLQAQVARIEKQLTKLEDP